MSVVPQWMHPFLMRSAPTVQPFVYDDVTKKKKTVGIYASQFYGPDLLGYVAPNQHNEKPLCKVPAAFVNGFSVDNLGDLVVPNGYPAEVTVYKGPHACKTIMGKFKDPYGQASDAVSADAANGTIVVGNIEESGSNKVGNIAVCTMAHGCTRVLHNSHIGYYGGGVAYSKTTGDCWISSEDDPSFSHATLTFFKGCKGTGQVAQGWKNAYYGGIVRDHVGNLISIDWETPAIWVYKGCNPTCHAIGGPFRAARRLLLRQPERERERAGSWRHCLRAGRRLLVQAGARRVPVQLQQGADSGRRRRGRRFRAQVAEKKVTKA